MLLVFLVSLETVKFHVLLGDLDFNLNFSTLIINNREIYCNRVSVCDTFNTY